MHIDPTYFNPVNPVAPVPPVGDDPTQTEYTAQAAFYLGYMASLINAFNNASGSPERNALWAEMSRIWTEYNGTIKGHIDPTSDIGKMIISAFGILGSGDQPDPNQLQNFLDTYESGDATTNPAEQIFTWLSKNASSVFNSDTHPETYFAFLMFMNSCMLGPVAQLGLSNDINAWLGEKGSGAPMNCWQTCEEFLFSYIDATYPDAADRNAFQALIGETFPADTQNLAPNYDAFMKAFTATGPDSDYTWWESQKFPEPSTMNGTIDNLLLSIQQLFNSKN